jgi:membrane dipeptidase
MRTDIDALQAGGVKAILSAVYIIERGLMDDAPPLKFIQKFYPRLERMFSEEPDDMCREQLNLFKNHVRDSREHKGDVIEFAQSYEDMQRIMGENKIAVVQSIEGAHVLKGNMDNLHEFHQRGVAHMIIPHFYPNEATYTVDAFPENLPLRKLGMMKRKYDLTQGLTAFGRELVDRMFEIGMIVDMTHGTPVMRQHCYDIARGHGKKRPLIMSHVGVHEFAPYAMNPTKEDIRAIADTGGVVGIIAMTYWLSKPEVHQGAEIILKTIDHLIQHGGEDVVAFGSDFDGFTGPPKDWKSPRDYAFIRELLLKHYSEEQAQKFLNGNADRVLKMGWGKG